MKRTIPSLLAGLILLAACEEPMPHIIFDDKDSTEKQPPVVVKDNYDGEIPGLDAKVIDYTLPNPYQHKNQMLMDSTMATSWDAAGFPEAKRFVLFFKTFQWDVMDRNKEKIAGMVDFPLRDYKTKKEFLKNFDSIFTDDFVHEILYQDPLAIYRDEKGAMIGNDGQLWFKMKKGRYRIIEINP